MKNLKNLIITCCIILNFAYSATPSAINNSGFAVILVDMQYGFYDRLVADEYGFYNRSDISQSKTLEQLVNTQIELLKWAVSHDIPVMVLEYTTMGATDSRLMNVIKNHKHKVITKYTNNGFNDLSKYEVEDTLREWGIDSIIIAGINGCCCVHDTAVGGIKSGFDVMTSSDIVADLNERPILYPNYTWFFKNKKFVVFENLQDIIGN